MDPTLAALIGTALGAVVTASVPVITIRARRQEAERTRRRDDAVALMDALMRMVKARRQGDWQLAAATHTEAVVARERLLLSSSRRDTQPLEVMTAFVVNSTTSNDNGALISVSIEAMSRVLRRWARGELSGERIADAYGVDLDRMLDERAADGQR